MQIPQQRETTFKQIGCKFACQYVMQQLELGRKVSKAEKGRERIFNSKLEAQRSNSHSVFEYCQCKYTFVTSLSASMTPMDLLLVQTTATSPGR